MKRFAALATIGVLAGAGMMALAADTQPAASQPAVTPVAPQPAGTGFANDFTTGMGRWKLANADGAQDAEGLKLTKIEKLGGIIIDGKPAQDMSAFKTIDMEIVNAGEKATKMIMKIKSGTKTRTDEKGIAVPVGTTTLSFKIAGGDIDPAKVDYMKFWIADQGDAKLTIKKITLAGEAAKAPAASAPATAPAAK